MGCICLHSVFVFKIRSWPKIDVIDSRVLKNKHNHSTQFSFYPFIECIGICVEIQHEGADLTEESLVLQIALTNNLNSAKGLSLLNGDIACEGCCYISELRLTSICICYFVKSALCIYIFFSLPIAV